jgi:AcrR family transcriptional regulator
MLFADLGFEKVLIRDIADACGVATSLVHHHFGKKSDLRDACREYVIGQIRETLSNLSTSFPEDPSVDQFDQMGMTLREGLGQQTHLIRFLALTFAEGHPASQVLFKEYFDVFHSVTKRFAVAGLLRDDLDPIWITTQTIYNQLGTAFLYDQLKELLGDDPYSPEISQRRTSAFISIAKSGVIRST